LERRRQEFLGDRENAKASGTRDDLQRSRVDILPPRRRLRRVQGAAGTRKGMTRITFGDPLQRGRQRAEKCREGKAANAEGRCALWNSSERGQALGKQEQRSSLKSNATGAPQKRRAIGDAKRVEERGGGQKENQGNGKARGHARECASHARRRCAQKPAGCASFSVGVGRGGKTWGSEKGKRDRGEGRPTVVRAGRARGSNRTWGFLRG